MKKQFLISTLVLIAVVCKSQDQLFKNDNSKLLVKITEVSPEEIKYKLYSNLNGPSYVVNKSEVTLIIYENGQHEVISSSQVPVADAKPAVPPVRPYMGMNKADSLKYYKYQSSLSINFFSFINSEIGLIYQRDFFKNNFNIVIPVAVGVSRPVMTESAYFNNGNNGISLDHKNFEVGFGINYYPSFRFPVNYYVGPSFRYMQFSSKQTYNYYTPPTGQYPYYTGGGYSTSIIKNGTLSSYCYSITNGFVFRTRSRLMLNLFGSLGFKSDVLSTTIVDPITNLEVQAIRNPVNIYFWAGFAIGYCF